MSYQRGNNLVKKAKELHGSMGAEIKTMIMPTWKGGKPKVIFIYFIYQSGKRVDLG
jgi:hypothetical protein